MKKIIWIVIIVALVYFIFPKSSGHGGTGLPQYTLCECLGVTSKKVSIGPWEHTCYGIPYSCQDYDNQNFSN